MTKFADELAQRTKDARERMNTKKVIELLKSGVKPLVRLEDNLWDDSFGLKGMIAEITEATIGSNDELVQLRFDFNRFREHNLALQSHDWYIYEGGSCVGKGTAFEAGHIKDDKNIYEEVYFDVVGDVPVVLAEDNKSVLSYYLISKSPLSYVEWLEAHLQDQWKLNGVKLLETMQQEKPTIEQIRVD